MTGFLSHITPKVSFYLHFDFFMLLEGVITLLGRYQTQLNSIIQFTCTPLTHPPIRHRGKGIIIVKGELRILFTLILVS